MSLADIASTRRALVGHAGLLATMAATGTTVAALAAGGDAALLSLSKEFEAAWAEEIAVYAAGGVSDAEADRVHDRVSDIIHEIEKHPSTTIDGLILKARACAWCQSGQPFEDNSLSFSSEATTDLRLASSILRDLIAISGRPVTAY